MANKHSFSKLNKNINNYVVVLFSSRHFVVRIVLTLKNRQRIFNKHSFFIFILQRIKKKNTYSFFKGYTSTFPKKID